MRKPNRVIAALLALNAILTVAVVALVADGGLLPKAAAALPDQPDKDPGKSPFNTGEKINQISGQVDAIAKKLIDIEKKLNSGISVKVTEMPEVIIKDPAKKK